MAQTNTALQWITLLAALGAAVLGIFKYFNYRTHADRVASVGQTFNATVDALAAKDQTKQLAAAILLRRFFDPETEQGEAGTPYEQEAVAVIAALLRGAEPSVFQKLLADGLAYASTLRGADLQDCNLTSAFLGERRSDDPDDSQDTRRRSAGRPSAKRERIRRPVDLTDADLFGARLAHVHLRGVTARRTVFYRAILHGAVFKDADLTKADFRDADLTDARFDGANLTGARFAGADLARARFVGACLAGAGFINATNVPPEVAALLGNDARIPESLTTPVAPGSQA